MYNTYDRDSRRHNTGSRTIVQYLQYRKPEIQYRKQDKCTIPTILEAGQLYNTYNAGSRTILQYRKQDSCTIVIMQEAGDLAATRQQSLRLAVYAREDLAMLDMPEIMEFLIWYFISSNYGL